jgi:TP901 family phage tail tape measure protein
MATTTFPLQIILGATDGVSGILGKVEGRLGKFGAKAGAAGRKLTLGLTAPIVGLGAAVVHASAGFETEMNNVAAVTRSTGTPALQEMRDLAQKLGAETQFSAGQVAAGMGVLAQSGLSTAKILGTTELSLELAAAGTLEFAEASNIVTGIMASQQEGTDSLSLRTDQLTRVSTSAKTNILELGEALNVSGAIGKAAGLTFEDNVAILGKLADGNKTGAEAGLILRRSLSRLLNPSAEARTALGQLDLDEIDVLDDKGKIKDFVGLLGQLEKKGATAGQVITIFGEIAGPSILNLLGQGVPAIEELRDSIDGVSAVGARAEMAAVRMAGAQGGILGFKSAMEALAIAIGDSGLLQWFTDAIKGVSGYVRELAKSSPKTLKWATAITALVATIGPLLILLGKMATGVSVVAKGLTFIIPGLLGFATTLVTTVIPAVVAWTVALLANPVFWIGAAIAGVVVAIIALAKNWRKVVAWMKSGFSDLLAGAKSAFTWILDKLDEFANWIIPDWLKSFLGAFSSGEDMNINVNDSTLASVASGSNIVAGDTSSSSSSKVRVEFDNLPEGARVSQENTGSADVDLGLGFSMMGTV